MAKRTAPPQQPTDRPTNRFAVSLKAAMEPHGLTVKDIAEAGNISYEHARRLVNGIALPSKSVTRLLTSKVGLAFDNAWKTVLSDKLEKQFGKQVIAEHTGKNPRLSEWEGVLLRLTEEQNAMLMQMARSLVKS